MTRTVITIGAFPSMPGRFYYTLKVDGVQKSTGRDAGNDPAAAAAKAIELAGSWVGTYQIFAPAKVLAYIPEEIRSGVTKP